MLILIVIAILIDLLLDLGAGE